MTGDDGDVRIALARRLYAALADGERAELDAVVDPDFVGRTTEGLPGGLGGTYVGAGSMRRDFWGRIAADFVARAEPAEYLPLVDGRLLVLGRYTGTGRATGRPLDAAFAHVLDFADGRVTALRQVTDSARWADALAAPAPAPGPPPAPAPGPGPGPAPSGPGRSAAAPAGVAAAAPRVGAHPTVELVIESGLAEIRLDRPAARNAIDAQMADDLLTVATECSRTPGIRAVLLSGNGPAFSVGGDLHLLAGLEPDALADLLTRMTTAYHRALGLLAALDAPIVAAVHGAAAGGGLGLLYAADIAVAAEGTRFASGFTALGLSGDGSNSWYLPRLVGPRRAARFYLDELVLDAATALDWGLVSLVVPAEDLESTARAEAERLAAGPTRAYGEIRRLLRESWGRDLGDQLAAETAAIARSARTADATGAIQAFVDKAARAFEGR